MMLGDMCRIAAIWHWYVPLCIYIWVLLLLLLLSIPFSYFSLIWHREIRWNGRRYRHVLALGLCALLTPVIFERLTLPQTVFDICVFFCSVFVLCLYKN